MLEFLYTTLVLFIFCFSIFIIFPKFKHAKMIMIIIQIIFSAILASNNFYRKHSLYSAPPVQYIQSTNFYPINSLYAHYNINGEFINISYHTMDNNKFSLIQTEKYSAQCLEHYFIEKDEICPITDIKFETEMNNIYQKYIQISDDEYFYYTNKNKLGKLYRSFNYTEFEGNKEDTLTNDEINKIARKEFNKISNPILDFKYFIKFFDVICILLIITSLCLLLFEYDNDRKIGVLRIMNISLQIIILIIYIVRFSKFIKVKQFLFDNEDIYENDSYFPNKVFNMDSFPLALSINIFIINTLYFVYPNHVYSETCLECLEKKIPKNFFTNSNDYGLFIYIFFLIASKFIFEMFDFFNDVKILATYNNLIYNWKISPIKSITLTNIESEELKYNARWKGYIFQYERLKDFNYVNLYSNHYSKLCGKDNYGNKLYFPSYVDCPINDIIVSELDENKLGYTKIKLNDNKYLYYTNQATEGKIVIDLRSSYDSEIPLNPGGDDDSNYFSIPFYEEIDFDNKYLYSINYLGINSTKISGNKIEKFESKLDIYDKLYITKIVFFCIEYTSIIIIIFIYFCREKGQIFTSDHFKIFLYILFFISLLLNFIYFILIIVCLGFHREYVITFMNKINFDFEKNKNDYKWNVAVLLHFFFYAAYVIIYFSLENKFEFNNIKNPIVPVIEPPNNIDRNAHNVDVYGNNENTINNKDIKDLENEKLTLKNNLDEMTKNFNKVSEERDTYKKKYEQLINENKNKFNNTQDEDVKEKVNEEESIKKLQKIIKEKDETISNLEETNKTLLSVIKEYNNMKNALKLSITFDLKEGEKLMCLIFISTDQEVKQPIICKDTHKFNEVENLLYEKCPVYKEYDNVFLANGNKINKSKTLIENGIKDGQIITMTTFEEIN